MTSSPSSNYDVISDFDLVTATKYATYFNFLVTLSFYSRLSSNFVEECKTRGSFLFEALKLVSVTISDNMTKKLFF